MGNLAHRDSLIQRHNEMSANIVGFCRFLRAQGFLIGPSEESDALKAMTLLPLRTPETLRDLLKTVLVKHHRQLVQFDRLYRDYWKQLEKAVDSKVKEEAEETAPRPKPPAKNKQASLEALKSWLYGKNSEETMEIATYSPGEVLTQKDFSTFSEEELEEVKRLVQILAKSLANRYNRRYRKSKRLASVDLRNTMRQAMRKGGEIQQLYYRKRRQQKLKLVLLCDVSKSMDLYSRFLIQFSYAFQMTYQKIETFVFSTSLQRITEELRYQAFSEALDALSSQVKNWSGGTQIGASLHRFLEDYAHKILDRHTLVLIMSDGWDTGDTSLLANSMRNIHRRAGLVVWLNPLAGNPNYEPSVQGMQAALPYVDIFAPAHNVESLEKVLKDLKPRQHKKRS